MSNINDFGRISLVMHTTGLIERMEKCTMNEQQEKILAVLDMSEDRQWKWITEGDRVIKYFPDDNMFIGDPQKYLADLAFRLRDELESNTLFLNSLQKVARYVKAKTPVALWGVSYAKPIHWIIAAILAKEKANE